MVKGNLTTKILIAMLLGTVVGLVLKLSPASWSAVDFFVDNILGTLGTIFVALLKMLVVPVVFVSLVCGAASLGNIGELGRIGGKTILLYIFTTAVAVTLAITLALFFGVGESQTVLTHSQFAMPKSISLKSVFIGMFPTNPIKALAEGNMLQIILFALLFGVALSLSGKKGEHLRKVFNDLNSVIMKLIHIVMEVAPYGVFCLISALFAKQGYHLVIQLLGYFAVVLAGLLAQLVITYPILLNVFARLNPIKFFKKIYTAMVFAFGVSSSNASIPVVLEVVKTRLGVNNTVASFVIPLGATINMDGTSIMQGVATVFIAHVYHVSLGFGGYLTVVLMATLASIGTAGVPSVGLITLAMVLQQVGLPVQGIALIIGVDRLLDMARTAVNIAGDSVVACVVGKSEKLLNEKIYNADQK